MDNKKTNESDALTDLDNMVSEIIEGKDNDTVTEESFSETKREKKSKRKKKPKKKGRALKIIAAIVCVLIVIVTLGVSYLQGLVGGQSAFGQDFSNSKKYQWMFRKYNLYSDLDASGEFANTNVVNVLLFGMDKSQEREGDFEIFRPDTIMLASINLETSAINILSIPRDSYVYIYGRGGKDKINACFYYGMLETDSEDPDVIFQSGVKTLTGTVSELLGGIPINYYVGVDMDAVVGIVDFLGGVEVDVPSAFSAGAYNYIEGKQLMGGAQFLTYARHRQYADGDIGRVSVQQQLVIDTFNTVKQMSAIKIPGFVGRCYKAIETNISIKQALALAMTLMNDFSAENINTDTMPGNFGNYYGISYWIISQYERVQLVKDMFGISISPDAQDERYKTNDAATPSEQLPAEGEPDTTTEDPQTTVTPGTTETPSVSQ